MEYSEEMKQVEECLNGWEEKGYEGFVAAYATLEYAQWIEKVSFDQAKELMYRFTEHAIHPEWY